MSIKKRGNLEIEEEAFNQNSFFWMTQKIILLLVFLFLVGVLFGLTGPGLLGQKTVSNEDHVITIKYDFFIRQNSVHTLRIYTENIDSSILSVGFSKEYINHQEIKNIIPIPISSEIRNGRILFNFKVNRDNNDITFVLEPQEVGWLTANLSVNEDNFSFKQFTYP